ncbi:hypothetical protein SKAU_G00152880 [Synaphobranchus kaupii]|uniref:Uncharacterized protein n=1 Tax=Synaphobranchus kaupii TaxID=118154 RepID=A0A9Q1FGY7_SYNKA|nr:hypothetical protein SKAU_G00152880 [Synaphobranchus kaupii]
MEWGKAAAWSLLSHTLMPRILKPVAEQAYRTRGRSSRKVKALQLHRTGDPIPKARPANPGTRKAAGGPGTT